MRGREVCQTRAHRPQVALSSGSGKGACTWLAPCCLHSTANKDVGHGIVRMDLSMVPERFVEPTRSECTDGRLDLIEAHPVQLLATIHPALIADLVVYG